MESMLARVCAPALAGIKPANLVAVDKGKYPDMAAELQSLNAQLNRKGIRFDVLRDDPKRAMVLVYRTELLERTLHSADVAAILESFGYAPEATSEEALCRLRRRMRRKEFPHEIGAFLGYPPADIRGFLRDRRKGVLLVGEWKVYNDAEGAKRTFSRYAACRKELLRRVNNGDTLATIFCAA